MTPQEKRQAKCEHVWQHESVIQPGGRGYSTSWCRKCKISAFAYERDRQPDGAVAGTERGEG